MTFAVAIILTACSKNGEESDDHVIITSVSVHIPSITPAEPAEIELSPSESREIGISALRIKVLQEIPESSIKIEKLSQPPTAAPPLEAVFAYYQIDSGGIPDHYLEEVIIEFGVTLPWLEEMDAEVGDVTLFRLVEGKWTPLQTQAVERSEGWVSYESLSPGLSNYLKMARRHRDRMGKTDTKVG